MRCISAPAAVAIGLGAAGLLYRLVLLLVDTPPTNSDEATMGLAALHIVTGRGYPIFFYGQYYMGTVEAYLAAPLFVVFGPSTFALRLPLLLLYGAFLALMWRLAARLYTPWLATATVGLLALGADRVVKDQLIAGGGYPEVVPAAALLMLLAVQLGLRPEGGRRRVFAFAGWGLVAGLMLWDAWLIVPYLVAAAGVLLVGCWRELPGRAGLALLVGVLAGAAPIIGHNLVAIPRNTSLQVFLQLQQAGSAAPAIDRWHGAVLLGVPLATGACDPSRCAPWQQWWAVAFPLLLVAAGVLAGLGLRRAQGPDRVREAGRLALVVGAGMSIVVYARSPAAADTPIESARYLACLLVSVPAVLWPLWTIRVRGVAAAVTAAAAGTALAATVALVAQVPEISRRADDQRALVAELRARGLTRIYSDYWTCNRITFATREQVICAVLGDDLRPGLDRYGRYRTVVAGAERPAYVVPVGSELDRRLARFVDLGPITTIAGYRIYEPSGRLPVNLSR